MLGELSDEEIDRVLRKERLGRIGCHARGITYVVPVSYVFDGSNVYVLSGEGLKVQLMRENPRVCFEVEQITHWANWKTVIAWGTFGELEGEQAEAAHNLLRSRLPPLIEIESRLAEREHSRPPGIADRPTLIYKIALEERSGRFERL